MPKPQHFLTYLHHTQLDKYIWYDSSESDKPITETATYTTKETNVHECSEIQTHHPSNQAATDLCLRPHGHCYQL